MTRDGVTPSRTTVVVVAIALAALAGHIIVNLVTPFGFQRDEFLYLAMGERLRLWRMDFPPFIALAANAQRALFGDALWSIRLFPAIVGSLLLLIAVLAAHRLAACDERDETAPWRSMVVLGAILPAGVFLRPAGMLQPVVFDQLWWTLALVALIERQRRDDARWWLAIGAALGCGLLTKFSIAFIGAGITAGVLLTPMRRDLVTRWPWLALLLTLAIGAPSLAGQIALDWPLTWQMRDLAAGQLERRSVVAFLADQPLLVGPLGLVLAAVGLVWLLRATAATRFRAVGVAIAVSWLLLMLQRGKGYYGAPVYPVLFAAGAVAMMSLRTRVGRRTAVAFTSVNAAFGVIGLPLALPILSPPATAAYAARLGVGEVTATNYGTRLALPQDYADMLGWEEQVRAVAEEWHALSPTDRDRAVLAADNYGRAGALDFYGPRHGLPRVVSGAGSYWFFGPGTKRGDVLIVLGGEEELRGIWASCRTLRTVGNAWAVEEEQRVEIWRCDTPRESLQALWPMFHPAR